MSSPTRCRICLDVPTAPFCPPCNHPFCYECITTHLRARSTCPTCGAPVRTVDLRPAPPSGAAPAVARTPDIAIAAPGGVMRPPPLPRRAYDAARPFPGASGPLPVTPVMRGYAVTTGDAGAANGGGSVVNGVGGNNIPGHVADSPSTRAAKRRAVALARTEAEMARAQEEDMNIERETSSNNVDSNSADATAVHTGARASGADGPESANAFRTPEIGTSAPHAAASAAVPEPPVAAALASHPLGLAGPLAAADNMSAEQLQLYISSLTQKLHAKEFSQRLSTSYLLHDFLTRTLAEKQAAIDLLTRHVHRLDLDVKATEKRLAGQKPGLQAVSAPMAPGSTANGDSVIPSLSSSDGRVLDERRRRLSTHFRALEARYFADDDDGANAPGTSAQRGISGGRDGSTPITGRTAALARLTDDIAKVTQFNQFRCRATLMHTTRFTEAPGADVFRASNIVSSIEFDRESEYVATAGVTKLIKIFEFSNIMRNLADVHYPVKEIQANAKLSWVAWNPYIRHHLASSDYEGVVTVWDAQQGVAIIDYEEHEKRAWSVDFCGSNPTLLASGSDDGRVKLWSTNEPDAVLTIDNHANVCSVKFNPMRGEMLAFGSAHHHVHYYDLRNTRAPVQVFKSHQKTVSYVKFISEHEMVSACADSSIKLWNLKTMELERTFTGHSNDRRFVGLSVNPDYIACGSETNSIYTYYKALPSPVVQYRFAGQDPLTGEDVAQHEEDSLFVSSVCWCPRHPSLLVAANSLGSIKVLALEDSNQTAAVAAATAANAGGSSSDAGRSSTV